MQEVAYVAYYFHWDLDVILDLEHRDRRRFAEAIASFNAEVNALAQRLVQGS